MQQINSVIQGFQIQHTCSKCGKKYNVPIFPYIDFSKNPQYYAKVKDLQIFKVKCKECGYQQYIQYDTLIVNPTYKYLLYFYSGKKLQSFRQNINYFVNNYLNKDQSVQWEKTTTRVVLQLNDLVQKMSIFQFQLNDKIIEVIKGSLIQKKLNKYQNVYFDGLNETNLQFITFDENKNVDKIKISAAFYNKIIQSVSKFDQKKQNFQLIDKNWVKSLKDDK